MSGAGHSRQSPPAEHPEDRPADPESVARIVCLRLLEQRARTRAELAEALRKRGVPDDAAGAVLDRLTEVGLIDDAALAESFAAAQHRERGLARRAVAHKLRRRGVGESELEQALSQIDRDSEAAAARALVPSGCRRCAASNRRCRPGGWSACWPVAAIRPGWRTTSSGRRSATRR